MENDVFDGLQILGYEGELLQEGGLEKALHAGIKSADYRHAVVWLTSQLKSLCNLDEEVHDIDSADDTIMFMMELSGFLKDMGCQYKFLTEGYMTERLQTQESRLLLLHYLLTELQAVRMTAVNQTQKPKLEVTLNETPTASELKSMLMALKFPKPPDNISPEMLFGKVELRLKEVVNSASPELLGKPLFTGVLSDQQWHTLTELNKELRLEYQMRREMLMKRLDVTVQSFQWSDRVKDKENVIASVMEAKRSALVRNPSVRLSDLLAAREDLAIIEKTSNASVRKNTQTKLNKLIIGQVPDRGGRTTDQAPPPPEMPSWQKDRNPGGGGGGGGGGGRGGGGWRGGGGRGGRGGGFGGGGGGGAGGDRNRVQGGWNQGDRNDRNDRGDRGGGGYQGGGGRGGHQNRGGQYQDRGGQYQDRDRGGQYQDRDRGHQDRDRGHQDRDRGGHYQDRSGGGGGGGGGGSGRRSGGGGGGGGRRDYR